jgi:hypothetical protein
MSPASWCRALEGISVEGADCYLPTAPDKLVVAIQRDSGVALQSAAKAPFLLAFDVRDRDGDPADVHTQGCIFKVRPLRAGPHLRHDLCLCLCLSVRVKRLKVELRMDRVTDCRGGASSSMVKQAPLEAMERKKLPPEDRLPTSDGSTLSSSFLD